MITCVDFVYEVKDKRRVSFVEMMRVGGTVNLCAIKGTFSSDEGDYIH
jgi:hypothetical protein